MRQRRQTGLLLATTHELGKADKPNLKMSLKTSRARFFRNTKAGLDGCVWAYLKSSLDIQEAAEQKADENAPFTDDEGPAF
jgi:hypothetical protein